MLHPFGWYGDFFGGYNIMYAIVDIKGFQFKLSEGSRLKVPRYDVEVGKKITFPEVLLVSDDAGCRVGTPFVDGAVVEATVTEHGKHDKVIVFKKKRRKDYSVKRGHRQEFTEIEIGTITLGGKSPSKGKKSAKNKEPEESAAPAGETAEVVGDATEAAAGDATSVEETTAEKTAEAPATAEEKEDKE